MLSCSTGCSSDINFSAIYAIVGRWSLSECVGPQPLSNMVDEWYLVFDGWPLRGKWSWTTQVSWSGFIIVHIQQRVRKTYLKNGQAILLGNNSSNIWWGSKAITFTKRLNEVSLQVWPTSSYPCRHVQGEQVMNIMCEKQALLPSSPVYWVFHGCMWLATEEKQDAESTDIYYQILSSAKYQCVSSI